jgi:hypothetical protein
VILELNQPSILPYIGRVAGYCAAGMPGATVAAINTSSVSGARQLALDKT